MALNVRRAALLVAAGCAVVAVAYLPPRARFGREYVPSRLNRTQAELRRAEMGLTVLEYRDSLLGAMRSHPGEPLVVSLYAHGVLPDSAADMVRQRLGELVPRSPPSGIRTGVALIAQRWPGTGGDEAAGPPVEIANEVVRGTMSYLSVPSAGDAACLTLASVTLHRRVRSPTAALARVLARMDQELIGPCWYAREFGPPGSAVAEWLAGGGALYATRFSGARPQVTRRGPSVWLRDALGIENRPYEPYFIWQPFGGREFAEVSCLNGRTDRCRDVLMDPLATIRRDFRFWQSDVPGVVMLEQARAQADERWLLADLLAAEGREHFARFWQSSLAFDSAFTDAFGTSPGKWMRAWVGSHLGPAPYPPWPGARDVVLTVAAIVVLMIAGSGIRLLRQID